tara:strand:- start:6 stop:623 length:618 start_codon:yes stop_codon:yes gene_type:complete
MVSLKTLLEKLGKDATAGDYVKDFRKSDAPQFKGKSKEKRHKMAIAAYLDAKDAEKNERISTVDVDQKKRDLKVARIDKKIKDLKNEGKAYGPTGIAYAVKSGHPDEVDPRTRKKYPERQTAKYKKQWAKNNKESVSFNEISAKMLNRYYDKAKTSHDKAANSAFARHLRKEPGVDKDLAVADRRKKGIKLAKNRAIKRLRGEIK